MIVDVKTQYITHGVSKNGFQWIKVSDGLEAGMLKLSQDAHQNIEQLQPSKGDTLDCQVEINLVTSRSEILKVYGFSEA